jgi:hypothetical protein
VSNGEETSVVSSLGTLETEDITGYVISIWKHVIMLDIFFPEGVCAMTGNQTRVQYT